MRWEDERYVRVYTRDTVDWQYLSFEAQGLLTLLLRKVDRAGILEFGRHGVEGVAAAIGHPNRWDTIKPALDQLVADGCVAVEPSRLVLPNFIEAQEAKTSDRERQRKSRESARVRHTASQPVTSGHTESQPVTLSLAVPSRAEPAKPTVPEKTTAVVQAPVESSLRDHLEADFKAQKGVAYSWVGGRGLVDDNAVIQLLAKPDSSWEEIRRRWRIALKAPFPLCRGLADLSNNWNAYATEQTTGPPSKPKDIARGTVRAEDQAHLHTKGEAF